MNEFRPQIHATNLAPSLSQEQTPGFKLLLRISGEETPGVNSHYFAQMLASQQAGTGSMPARLGLSEESFTELLDRHFHNRAIPYALPDGKNSMDVERVPEFDELCTLLNRYRVYNGEPQTWMSMVVATACMGSHHLWQDMGLWSRKELSALMNDNFPELAWKNTGDMKWKKFIYKQLCEEEGIYVCRAPSCDVCSDYANCFGSEE
ncbi:MAG: nitrogen fixation protein NifQ [Gammaproteobacteria bacterium]